ncbi:helix-turn-helix domain-containing protein [Blautia sp.]|uniref:helix-turn-helix domain-containing protein n=1 Tax=Blautia sp. TaxID=1955243 RepID=UPI003AB534BA
MERSVLESEFLSFDGRRGTSRSDSSIHRKSGREKELNIAYRFRIYPTEEQKILLGKTFGCCRFLYKQMLNDEKRRKRNESY